MKADAINRIRKDVSQNEPTLRASYFCVSKEASNGAVAYRAGEYCPKCKKAILDYDGMLNLVCPDCDFIDSGCFT